MDTSTQRNSSQPQVTPPALNTLPPPPPQSALRLLFWCCRTPTAGIIRRLTVLLVDSELATVSGLPAFVEVPACKRITGAGEDHGIDHH
jgi:hypothetical protein